MLVSSQKRAQGFKNKVGAFDVWHNFLKEIIFNCSSDRALFHSMEVGFQFSQQQQQPGQMNSSHSDAEKVSGLVNVSGRRERILLFGMRVVGVLEMFKITYCWN